jgi:hypothetical protein
LDVVRKKNDTSTDVKPLVRLLRFLPERDVTLIVLKGHLLIEEQLVSLLEHSLKHPAALDERRFSFAHRLCLVKAMNYDQDNLWLWTSISKLNVLRNDLAHKLEPARLAAKIDDFVQSLPGLNEKHEKIETRLRHALIFLCGALQRIQNE